MREPNNIRANALHILAEGVREATDVVRETLGPAGRNVIIEEQLPPYSRVINDGATILERLEFEDPVKKRGLGFLKEAATRSNSNSGDGSTTTSILLNEILQQGIMKVGAGTSPLEIKNSLDECLPIIEKSIEEQTRKITVMDIPAVAKIAGENEEIARILGEIYEVIGETGIIYPEGSGTYDTEYKLIEGVRFTDTGYLSPYMVHDEEAKKAGNRETKAVYINPSILVTKQRIGHVNDIDPLLQALDRQGKKDLVIFADDMDSGVARTLIESHKQGVVNILIIKAPVLWKNYVYEDFAKVTGSTILEDASGINFKNLSIDHLGTCGKLVVDKDEATVIGTQDIGDHVRSIQMDESIPHDIKALRLSYLTAKTAILKLGAKSETELSYLLLKCEDAIHSSRLALREGIVPGGGVALINASVRLPDTIGGQILKKALQAPARQLYTNAGKQPPTDFLYSGTDVGGFDAKRREEIGNMFDAGIVDAALIVKGAVRNALGIASTILTASSVVTIPTKTPEEIAHDMLMQKGMRPF